MGIIIDLVGKKFGRLTVLDSVKIKKRLYWFCLCDCGNEITTLASSLNRGFTRSCGCIKREVVSRRNIAGYKGIEELTGSYLSSVIRNAKIRNIEHNITKEYLWDLFLKQDKKCALSGVLLTFGNKGLPNTTASLDRIDSSIGYIEGNVQWTHKNVNRAKMELSNKDFIEMCKQVYEYIGNKS